MLKVESNEAVSWETWESKQTLSATLGRTSITVKDGPILGISLHAFAHSLLNRREILHVHFSFGLPSCGHCHKRGTSSMRLTVQNILVYCYSFSCFHFCFCSVRPVCMESLCDHLSGFHKYSVWSLARKFYFYSAVFSYQKL